MKNIENSLAYSLIVMLKRVIIGFIILTILIVFGFLYYIKNNMVGSTTIDATGIYNLVDSEGNVIATDLTEEDLNKISNILNGKN